MPAMAVKMETGDCVVVPADTGVLVQVVVDL